jgi:glycosyltransferase involved in cell wall biosynthesis
VDNRCSASFRHAILRDAFVQRYRLVDELRLAAHMRSSAPALYHILYGEAGFRYTGRFAAKGGHRILATFHLPAHKLAEHIRHTRHLRQLSGIVCASRSQFSFFDRAATGVPRHHVLLGVDCEFFSPAPRPPTEAGPRLVCVGELAESVLSLLHDSTLRRDLGTLARRRAQSFDWTSICDRMQAVYDEIMP